MGLDIALIVEGTYPYVSGGVSSWCHQIVQGMPQHNFHLLILHASSKDKQELKYKLPENVKSRIHIPLYKPTEVPFFLPRKNPLLEDFKKFIHEENLVAAFEAFYPKLLEADSEKLIQNFFYGSQSFDYLKEVYQSQPIKNHSFLHFFWMMRSLFGPYLRVLTTRFPRFDIYHTVSTGYAGTLGACAKILYPDSRLIITEHGIYTRERSMELAVAPWPDTDKEEHMPEKGGGYYKLLWGKSFRFMSELAYKYADQIFSLFQKNNDIQIREGADPAKVFLVRNGIDQSRFEFRQRNLSQPLKLGFLGRVVPIKDVKTFLRACAIVRKKLPNLEVEIAGGTEEDPQYYQDCLKMTTRLGLDDIVTFPGKVDAKAFFERTHLMALTSLSEGQPLVMLEAMACGVPVIAPDVGGCREIIEGGNEKRFHPAGLITQQANPVSTARAIERLLSDHNFYANCSKSGREIVEEYYDQDKFLKTYERVYAGEL